MIKSRKLSFAYEGVGNATPALVDIDIEIAAGEFVAILGHNGSGKSTLARHFNALLVPGEGSLWVCGLDTSVPENTWKIRQSAGMVFQNPDNQIVATTVEEDVAFGPENLGVPPDEIRRRVTETLALVGMSDHATAAPHNLSGGQKQRVAIAGVLAMRPNCIVLDEPSAMLDPAGRREVMQAIEKLNGEGITIILITHFMEEAARAGRVIVMDAGKVVMDDTPQKIFSQVEKMHAIGLGVPCVTALAHELRKLGIPMPADILTVDEFAQEFSSLLSKAHPQPVANVRGQGDLSPCGGLGVEPPRSSSIVLELKNVSHVYSPGSVFEKIALDDISLRIHRGEIVAIIGHTGSGKSTLIQHFNALLKPTSGVVLFSGTDIHEKKNTLREIRRHVGLVFQYPEHQLFEATVFEDVAFGPKRMGLSKADVRRQTVDALDAVGLGVEFYEKSPFELSGGQKRRAAIAGVLAMRPEVLVLDEPAAGLDPQGKDEIFAQIKTMHANLGITVVVVSHSMDDAAQLANRVIVMNNGRVVCDETPAEVFARGDFLKSIGLDVPQISQLMAKLGVDEKIFTVDDAVKTLGGKLLQEDFPPKAGTALRAADVRRVTKKSFPPRPPFQKNHNGTGEAQKK